MGRAGFTIGRAAVFFLARVVSTVEMLKSKSTILDEIFRGRFSTHTTPSVKVAYAACNEHSVGQSGDTDNKRYDLTFRACTFGYEWRW